MKNSEKTALKAGIIQNMIIMGFILLFIVTKGGWVTVDTVFEIGVAVVVLLALTTIAGHYYWSYFKKKLRI